MASFDLTEEQRALVDLSRKFAQKEMRPVAAKYDKEETFPEHIFKEAHKLGLLNLRVPEEYGGAGLGCFEEALVCEEFAWGCVGIGLSLIVNSLGLRPILEGASEEQKQRWLPPFGKSPKFACFALTEPGSGSDAGGMQLRIQPDGDYYILNGTKQFITNGDRADLISLFGTLDPAKSHKAITALVVEKGTKGVKASKNEDKMGQRASPTTQLVFEDAAVPKKNLLGKEGGGWPICLATLEQTRPWIGALAVGLARAAIEHSIDYTKQRKQFGQPIINFQITQWKLGQMAQEIEASRLLTWKAAWLVDRGEPATIFSSMAKTFATDTAMRATTEAVQMFGGYGYVKEFPVEKLMRDAKVLQIYEGSNEIQRVVIAEILAKSEGPGAPFLRPS